jgi:Mannosyltransferase (PIG-V)
LSAARELVAIRLAFLVVAAVSLLWAPGHLAMHAYGALGSLLFGAFAQWDAGWFIRIAKHGYDIKQSAAFFPLYPLLVRGLAFVLRSHLAAGVVISLVASAGAGAILQRLSRSRDAVLLLALYPIAYVFTAVYSDALFLLVALGSFAAAVRGRSAAAGVLGGLAVATRLLGLALLPALVWLLWRRGPRALAPLLLLPAALGAYMLYLHERFHDAFAFAHAEHDIWLRHTPTLGPLTGLWDALHAGEQGLAQLVLHLPGGGYGKPEQWAVWNLTNALLLVLAAWLTWVAWRRLGAAYGLYSLATLVIVLSSPAAVVPLVSLPRFLLADFPLFIVLAPYSRVLAPTFAALGAAAAIAFSHGAWVA